MWTLVHVQDISDRRHAEQARADSEANLRAVAKVMAMIRHGDDARQTVVDAAGQLADADRVLLFEPSETSDALVVTAATDPELVNVEIPLDATAATVVAYRTGMPHFVADPRGNPGILQSLVKLTVAESIFYAPVTTSDAVTGVMVVVWSRPIPDISDRHAGAVALLADQAGIALHQAKLLTETQVLAATDALTGLPNRRSWDACLDALVRTARRTHRPLTIALADLDHFKVFNDTYGHLAGDRLLRKFAATARRQLRSGDMFARWGGEEFALALSDCALDRAAEVLDRIREVVPDGQTCSFGYATWDPAESLDQLMQRVDKALYAAKEGGRDRAVASP
jgi:diguanylate cyclase (GGDEF)-like protein